MRADAGAAVLVGERERGDGPRRGRRTRRERARRRTRSARSHPSGRDRYESVASAVSSARGGAVARGVADHGQRRAVGPGRRSSSPSTPHPSASRRPPTRTRSSSGGRGHVADRHPRSRRDARDRGRAPAARRACIAARRRSADCTRWRPSRRRRGCRRRCRRPESRPARAGAHRLGPAAARISARSVAGGSQIVPAPAKRNRGACAPRSTISSTGRNTAIPSSVTNPCTLHGIPSTNAATRTRAHRERELRDPRSSASSASTTQCT